MRRIRWFNAEWPVSLRTLAAKMRANPFREDSIEGFIVDRVRENLVEGRFIEKIAFQETSRDPFGSEHSFETYNLSQTRIWDLIQLPKY